MKSLNKFIFSAFTLTLLILFLPLLAVFIKLELNSITDTEYSLENESPQTKLLKIPPSPFWLAIPRLGIISEVKTVSADSPDFNRTLSRNQLVHLSSSAHPGQLGTIIITSHYITDINLPWTNPSYYFLSRLKPNDLIEVGYSNERFTYEIDSITAIESYPNPRIDYSSQNLILLSSKPFIDNLKLQVSAILKSQ